MNIKNYLVNSAFYPASGCSDGTHLEILTKFGITKFVHVDYSISRYEVKNSLRGDFEAIGYQTEFIKQLSKEELGFNGFEPHRNIPLNIHEQNRIDSMPFIKDKYFGHNFKPFALHTKFKLGNDGNAGNKVKSFEILHIGGEACAVFDSLYVRNKVNPSAVVLLNCSEGYGDNWTSFSNPEFRLHQMVSGIRPKPTFLIENAMDKMKEDAPESSWPHYSFDSQIFDPKREGWVNIFKRE
jgi:hypothetical protein